jgi:hypothetical protein
MNAFRILTTVEHDSIVVRDLHSLNGRRVELIILPLEDEKSEWETFSLTGLAGAHGTKEPEYIPDEVKEKNPRYESR